MATCKQCKQESAMLIGSLCPPCAQRVVVDNHEDGRQIDEIVVERLRRDDRYGYRKLAALLRAEGYTGCTDAVVRASMKRIRKQRESAS